MWQVWPYLGLHLATVAKTAALLEQPEEAAGAAREAAKILQYTHPDSQIQEHMLLILQDMLRLQYKRQEDSFEEYYSL